MFQRDDEVTKRLQKIISGIRLTPPAPRDDSARLLKAKQFLDDRRAAKMDDNGLPVIELPDVSRQLTLPRPVPKTVEAPVIGPPPARFANLPQLEQSHEAPKISAPPKNYFADLPRLDETPHQAPVISAPPIIAAPVEQPKYELPKLTAPVITAPPQAATFELPKLTAPAQPPVITAPVNEASPYKLPMLTAPPAGMETSQATLDALAPKITANEGAGIQPDWGDSIKFAADSLRTPPPSAGIAAPAAGANVWSDQVTAARTRRQQAQQELADLNSKDYSIRKDENGNVVHRGAARDSDHNWWDVLKSFLMGAGEAARNNPNGNFLANLLGGGAVGAIGGIADRNFDEKYIDNNYRRPRLEAQYGRANQQLEDALKSAGLQLDNEGKILTNRGKTINNEQELRDYVRQTNPKLWESITADGRISEEESQLLAQAGYGATVPYDSRKFDTERVGGTTYASPSTGVPNYKPVPSLPIKEEEAYKDVTAPSGNKYTLPQGKAADMDIAITTGDINRAWDAAKLRNTTENKNIESMNQYERQQAERLAEQRAANSLYNQAGTIELNLGKELEGINQQTAADVEGLRNQLANTPATITRKNEKGKDTQYENPEREKLEKAITAREALGREQSGKKQTEFQNAQKVRTEAMNRMSKASESYQAAPKPKAQKAIGAAPRMSRIPQVTRQEFVRRAQGRGLSQQQVRAALKQAINDGVIK